LAHKRVKTLIIVIVSIAGTLGVLGGVGALVAKFHKFSGAAGEEVVEVRVDRATRGPLVEIVSVPGEVQPEPHLRVPISARVSARIVELPFKEWDVVTKGNPKASPPVPASVLVRLDAKDLEATMRSVKARYAAQEAQLVVTRAKIESQKSQIASAEATLKDAKLELDRRGKLLIGEDITQTDLDHLQAKTDEAAARLSGARHDLAAQEQELVVLRHNLAAAEAEIARSQEDLNNTVITSPIDGIVTRVRMKVGELAVVGVENSSLTNIMEVADLSQMVMLAHVDETNVAALKVGQHATVRMLAYRTELFDGSVESISPATVDANNGPFAEQMSYFEAKIKLNLKTPGRRIYTGVTADADIETTRHEGVRVPSQCVLGRPLDSLPDEIRKSPAVQKDKSAASVVFRVIDNKAVATPVVVGPSDETRTLITQGLSEGDVVIAGPYKVLDTIKHDQKVKVKESPTTGPTTAPTATTTAAAAAK
jgi:HlyD family secretion protein